MTERAHAILSPSFMHVALECDASVGLKESLPPEPAGAAAQKGTIIHGAAANRLEGFLYQKIHGEYPPLGFPPLEPEVEKMADAWRDHIWERAFQGSVTGKTYGIEEKLVFSEQYSLWGTADFWMIATDERAKVYGMVCDLKSGYLFVDADKNPQLAAYACALRREARQRGVVLDYVRAAIYQPYGDGDKWRETKFTGKQLDGWEKKFHRLAQSVFAGGAKYSPGEHCQYCPGRVRCKAYDQYRTKETGLKLLDASEIKFPEVPALPDDVLVRIVRHEKQLASFVKACRKELLNKLLSGNKVEGLKLVEARTKRKWDEEKVTNLMVALAPYGIEVKEEVLRGLTAVRDELVAKVGKKAAEEVLNRFLVKPPGGIVLADASDSRDEVKPTHGLFIEEEE